MSVDSTIRRRDFIAGTTATATGLALASESLAGGTSPLSRLTSAEFAPLVGQPFVVDGLSEQGTRQRGTLVLKEVVAHDTARDSNRPAQLRREAFSLRFESRDVALANDTHQVASAGMQPQGIFLHEMLDQRQAGERHYEAVFN